MDPLQKGNNEEEDSQCAEEEEEVDPRIQVRFFLRIDPDVATSESDIARWKHLSGCVEQKMTAKCEILYYINIILQQLHYHL